MTKAISVKYLPCTNTKPARYKAYDCAGNSHIMVSKSRTQEPPCLFTEAALQFAMDKMGWGGHWVGGHTKEGMVFVQVPHEDNANQFDSAGW